MKGRRTLQSPATLLPVTPRGELDGVARFLAVAVDGAAGEGAYARAEDGAGGAVATVAAAVADLVSEQAAGDGADDGAAGAAVAAAAAIMTAPAIIAPAIGVITPTAAIIVATIISAIITAPMIAAVSAPVADLLIAAAIMFGFRGNGGDRHEGNR